MKEHDDSLVDPLAAAFACSRDQLAADDPLRAAVFAQTVGVIRGRRRLKRCALAAALLGCYLAGVTTMGIRRTGHAEEQPPSGPTMAAKSQQPAPPAVAAAKQQQVAANKPSGFESWRRIGDHYLRQSGDISLAVAGYREAIDLASDEERRISPQRDNWLMMALKDARSKENKHVSESN
jgi:cytochrome c-type biogenesis protein CcmH/NrfG